MFKGCKVMLREKRIGDASNDYAWRGDPEMARLDAISPLAISFQDFMLGYANELHHSSPRRYRFAIDSSEGKHIGNCTYYDIDKEKGEAELGILIGDREYWNKGYGTDAISTLVSHIFEVTDLKRIYLSTLDWNIRAQKCFEKCGFVACGRFTRGQNTFIVMEIHRSWLKKAAEESKLD